MSKMVVHMSEVRQTAFGGLLTTSLCRRLNARSADGMNVSDVRSEVTCKFCIKLMAIADLAAEKRAARTA